MGDARLGLNDQKVIKCEDRGDKSYHDDHPTTAPASTNGANPFHNDGEIVQKTMKELEEAQIEPPKALAGCFFIPRESLNKIMTVDRIQSLVDELNCFNNLSEIDKQKLAHGILSGNNNRCKHPCLKLFAALIGLKMHDFLLLFINDGLSDCCLPLEWVGNNSTSLKCRDSSHHHTVFDKLSVTECRTLCQWTHSVTAPYFTKPANKHVHYIFNRNDILPITPLSDGESSKTSSLKHPTAKSSPALETHGGFSEVTCIKLHPSHFNFGSPSPFPGEKLFALKRLISKNRDDFNKELASLLRFQDQDKYHLIKLLVSYEVRTSAKTGEDSSDFFLLFPWADGNLLYYWETHSHLKRDKNLCTWMVDQCLQLARALQLVHNERDQNLRHFPDIRENEHDLYGRHGDIKAENVLWFKGEIQKLFLTDFGLGRLHTHISRSNQNPKDIGNSATYRAPEFDLNDGKISRASDVFSLGCMYLEFVTWYLEGHISALQEFPDHRAEMDIHNIDADTFFRIEVGPGNQRKPVIKSQVKNWIERLKNHEKSNQHINSFLDLIQNQMLHPYSQNRIKSPPLVNELRLLVRTLSCESEEGWDKIS